MEKRKYSLCIIFNQMKDQVLLIEKNRPDWQKGKLNGIGGKFEDNESVKDCTIREVYEETGIKLDFDDITYIGYFNSDEYIVYITTASIDDEDFVNYEQKTDEKLFIYDIDEIVIVENILPSTRTAIFAALQSYEDDSVIGFVQNYN